MARFYKRGQPLDPRIEMIAERLYLADTRDHGVPGSSATWKRYPPICKDRYRAMASDVIDIVDIAAQKNDDSASIRKL